ncbi:MAG: TolC family outer membrane protein [Paracoccaceae bacterium]|nr:MAG: TolC family outer membrane protein [Paracoccaceae bacterium]
MRALAVAAFAALSAVPAGAETLADALISAYRNSNLLEQNRAVLRAADEDAAQALAALRPVLRASGGLGYSNQRTDQLQASLDFQAQITIFDSGSNALALESARESVLATRQSLVNLEQQVLLSAVRAYVGVRLQADIVALREANLRLITQELRAAQDRFEVGEITRTDVAQAEARLAASRSELVGAQGDLAIAREGYLLAVGREPGRLSPVPRLPRTADSLAAAKRVAQAGHPLIRQAQHQVTISELGIARSKAAMGPTITGTVTQSYRDVGKPSLSGGLTVNQTLYAGGQLSSLYRQSLARRDQARAGLHQTVAEVGLGVGEAWANVAVANASIEASDRQIRAAQTAFEGVREEARLGARTTLDVLDAEQDLLLARTNRVSAEATRVIQVYTLLAAMGLLTADHLGLGIPTYDPAAYYNAVKNAPATSAQGRKLDRVLEAIGKTR